MSIRARFTLLYNVILLVTLLAIFRLSPSLLRDMRQLSLLMLLAGLLPEFGNLPGDGLPKAAVYGAAPEAEVQRALERLEVAKRTAGFVHRLRPLDRLACVRRRLFDDAAKLRGC